MVSFQSLPPWSLVGRWHLYRNFSVPGAKGTATVFTEVVFLPLLGAWNSIELLETRRGPQCSVSR